jgi:hypothetical protein
MKELVVAYRVIVLVYLHKDTSPIGHRCMAMSSAYCTYSTVYVNAFVPVRAFTISRAVRDDIKMYPNC